MTLLRFHSLILMKRYFLFHLVVFSKIIQQEQRKQSELLSQPTLRLPVFTPQPDLFVIFLQPTGWQDHEKVLQVGLY